MRRMLAYSVPITVLVLLWGLAPHHALPPSSTAKAATTTAVTRPAKASVTTGKTIAPPKGSPEFNATFSGSKLNTSVWGTCYPVVKPQVGCRNFGNPEEAEWYLPSQDQVYGGVLHLIAKKEPTPGTATPGGPPEEYDCRSGMITSWPSLKFKYGFVQVVARIPHGLGLWPALWLAAANLKYPPEMDMIESWGVNILTASYLHPLPYGTYRYRGLIPQSLTDGWQTYSLSWTRSKLIYYVGNTVILTVTHNIPHQAMYFIANVAEYLKPAAGYCNGDLELRSVKIWRN